MGDLGAGLVEAAQLAFGQVDASALMNLPTSPDTGV